MMSALAMAARCCPPPESCSGKASSRSERPRVCVISRKKAVSGVLPDRLKGKRMFSRTVSVGTRLKFWYTKPTLLRRNTASSFSFMPESRTPSTITSPSSGLSSAPIMFSRVVFPEPEAPMMAVNFPFSMERSIPSRALT